MVVHHRQAHAVADDELTFHHWVVLFDFAPDLVVGIRQSGTAKLGWVRDARADARLGGRLRRLGQIVRSLSVLVPADGA